MGMRDVFLITAALPLLASFAALLVDEKPRPQVEASVQDQVSILFHSGGVRPSGVAVACIRQKPVRLPALFIFLWQATPTSDSAFFYFLTDDIKVGPEFLGRVRLGRASPIFQTYLKEVRINTIMFWTSIVSVPLGFTQLLLIYHVNRQIAFMPTLVLAARLCPPGVEGTLFALLMSIFNGSGIVGSELGAALTKSIGVTETDFTNLGKLGRVLLCNLSSLLPLPFLKWIEEDEDRVARETKQQKGKRWWLAKKEPAKAAPPP
ncbi:BT1 family-domain-containing protein [Tribonema minus]|uniref:BT1 family-domain-containing protein n=1 Tax=Tribonema minus TaxID=303371 RepID=A0A835YL53_9STRA|nr:BT1 family-domain-containing protein [Tribonema minus]